MRYSIVLGCVALCVGCVTEEEECYPTCAPWQVCSDGVCAAAAGRCDSNADCAQECDLSTHVCIGESTCTPECESWEVCVGTSCTPAPGRCLDDTDCTPDAPDCNVATHTCLDATIDWADPMPAVNPAALIVTSETLRAPFERLAALHTVTGVNTEVITVEAICGTSCNDLDPTADTAKAIKDHLIGSASVSYVLLGGDIEHVPARSVYDEFTNPLDGGTFQEDFFTDFYYADLSEWDDNHDGVYADDGTDTPAYLANIGVGRLPVSTIAEAELAITKIEHHLTDYDLSSIATAALVSNVATNFLIDIDGAYYFEADGATCDVIPSQVSVYKLYASGSSLDSSAETLTAAKELETLEAGYNLVVHNGHGSVETLTIDYSGGNQVTGSDVYALTNSDYPIVLSCSCLAGAFDAADSAGEMLMNAPSGGAIGYLGNTATGLGLAGGAQLIDEVIAGAFAASNGLVGDALVTAHANFTYPDGMTFPVLGWYDTVDQNSYEWTQKAAVYFGDPMLPVWTNTATVAAPTMTVSHTALAGGVEITASFSPAATGTLRVGTGDHVYQVTLSGSASVELSIPESPSSVSVGFFASGMLAAHQLVSL